MKQMLRLVEAQLDWMSGQLSARHAHARSDDVETVALWKWQLMMLMVTDQLGETANVNGDVVVQVV